ncbi:VanZ family protein [Halomonas cupida]|uniref:VanZ family protein n=1 Tax=Halomonas cupida TaxID=44933 RepID=UPI003A8D0619
MAMTSRWLGLLDRRRMWAWLAVLVALVIALGSLLPGDELPASLPSDTLNHLVGYMGLAALIALSSRRFWWSVILAVGFGLVIEWAQLYVPGRSGGDMLDIAANAMGALIGAGMMAWLIRAAGSRSNG